MERLALNSTSLRTAGYEPRNAVLEIEFQDGAVYQFFAVPAENHSRLLQAKSHGAYFNSHIRNRFDFAKIHPALPPDAA